MMIEESWRTGHAPSPADRQHVEALVIELRALAPIGVREQSIVEEPTE
jgi:hypothetical protein